jgi:radical SAM-linked protein
MQRLRLRFGRREPVRFISHLDTMRCWERALRRASVPLDYTQGFTPHPKLAVAVPLAVGVTSDSELMDIWLRKWLPPQSVMMLLRRELPHGFTVEEVWEVPAGGPALQAMVQRARYVCSAVHGSGLDGAQRSVEAFLRADSVVHEFERVREARSVDLRPLVHALEVSAGEEGACGISMSLGAGQQGSARPDHLLEVLGFELPGLSIQRVELELGHPEPKEGRGSRGAR